MLKRFFDISTDFRFSKISVECSVHSCSCPWISELMASAGKVLRRFRCHGEKFNWQIIAAYVFGYFISEGGTSWKWSCITFQPVVFLTILSHLLKIQGSSFVSMQNSQFPSFVSYLIPNLPISDSLIFFSPVNWPFWPLITLKLAI